MKKILRPYQNDLQNALFHEWERGIRSVLAVSPTGSGKALTLVDSAIKLVNQGFPVCIEVHRKELVQQLCNTLSEEGAEHNIIAPTNIIKSVIANERKMVGRSFYKYNSPITVASVDTLNSRIKSHESWRKNIKALIIDEAAHVTKTNKWGRTVEYFPGALIAGFTATPRRLDRRGLGAATPEKDNDGVFETMVEGPTVNWLIDEGYLANYRIAIPESKYRKFLESASSDADYTRQNMAQASLKSHIEGDVVESYKKYCDGKQVIVFASDIATAERMEHEYKEAGITAKTLTGDTADNVRVDSLIDFREGLIKVLINVDLFDEGLDVSGIEGVIMARPTKSLGKFLQICGRGLRPVYAKGYDLSTREGRLAAQAAGMKPHAILIDHVGNIDEHGLPDRIHKWSLDRPGRRMKNISFHRICKNTMCNAPFDRTLHACPYCGHEDVPVPRELTGREALEQIDGDMFLLTPEQARQLWDETILETPAQVAAKVRMVAGEAAGKLAAKRQLERIEMQKNLSEQIAIWSGVQTRKGLTVRSIQKKFKMDFNMTITEALSMSRAEMENIMEDILNETN